MEFADLLSNAQGLGDIITILVVLSIIWGVRGGLWPFVEGELFPYIKTRSERNDRTIEELVQIRKLMEALRYETSIQSEQLNELSKEIVSCTKLSEAAIEFVNNHLNPLTPAEKRRRQKEVSRDDLFAPFSDNEN